MVVPEGLGVRRAWETEPLSLGKTQGYGQGLCSHRFKSHLLVFLVVPPWALLHLHGHSFLLNNVGMVMEYTSQAFCEYCDTVG